MMRILTPLRGAPNDTVTVQQVNDLLLQQIDDILQSLLPQLSNVAGVSRNPASTLANVKDALAKVVP